MMPACFAEGFLLLNDYRLIAPAEDPDLQFAAGTAAELLDEPVVESVLAFAAVVPGALELVEVVFDQTIKRGSPGVPGPVDPLGQAFLIRSSRATGLCAKLILRMRSILANETW